MNWELLLLCRFLQRSGELSNKNVNVTTIMFLMSGDLTGLCLYIPYFHMKLGESHPCLLKCTNQDFMAN